MSAHCHSNYLNLCLCGLTFHKPVCVSSLAGDQGTHAVRYSQRCLCGKKNIVFTLWLSTITVPKLEVCQSAFLFICLVFI